MAMALHRRAVTVGSAFPALAMIACSMTILLRFFPVLFFASLLTLGVVLVGLQGAVIMLRSRNVYFFWR